jgi:outer membrane lipoprotein-sorting protein
MKFKIKHLLIGLFSILFSAGFALAENSEEKGLAIAIEADKRDQGFKDHIANMQMILMNKYGEKSIRDIRMRTLEVDGDGDKSLIIFDSPMDVKGTAFLNFTHKVGDDDQWLYLPALKRVKRISANNKSGSFMGSEFSYEDISSQEVEKYTYKWLRDEEKNSKDCYVIERYPVDKKKSGYTKEVVWIDKDEYRMQRVEFYDRKDSLLKTLEISGYKKYLDNFWRAEEMHMVNHQTGKSTRLIFDDYEFATGLKDADFNKNSLIRIR